jgi:hypothetical protein
MGDIVDAYKAAEHAIWDHVGYKEDWRRLPLEDSREYFWAVDAQEEEWCKFSPKKEALEYWLGDHEDEYGDYGDCLYSDEIYTNRHLPKWVYRGAEFTLVCVDTHTDGNQFIRIFRNDMELKVAKRAVR